MTLLFFALIALTPAGAIRADQMFRNDAAHTGVYASTAAPLTRVHWRFHAKGPIISSPIITNGIVFVGSDDGNVYAVHASDGTLLWKHATNGAVRSTPAVAGDRVFVTSLDGYIYSLNASDGREVWHTATGGERRFTAPGIHGLAPRHEMMPDPYDLFLSSPAVAGGTLFVGSGDHSIYALDASSGAVKWTFTTGDVVHASPAVEDGVVYIGSWDRYFYALDAASGAVKWKYQTGDDRTIYNQIGIAGSAAVSDDTVYFGCRDSFFYALDKRTGALRWKHDEHGSWVIGTPAIQNGIVYFTTSDEKKFFALDAKTGKESFEQPYSMFSFSSPSIAGSQAYFGTFDGMLLAVDVRNGKLAGRFLTDGARAHRSAHLDAKGNLDMTTFYKEGTLDGAIVGLRRIFELGSIAGSPLVSGGSIYVGDTNGVLYSIGS